MASTAKNCVPCDIRATYKVHLHGISWRKFQIASFTEVNYGRSHSYGKWPMYGLLEIDGNCNLNIHIYGEPIVGSLVYQHDQEIEYAFSFSKPLTRRSN